MNQLKKTDVCQFFCYILSGMMICLNPSFLLSSEIPVIRIGESGDSKLIEIWVVSITHKASSKYSESRINSAISRMNPKEKKKLVRNLNFDVKINNVITYDSLSIKIDIPKGFISHFFPEHDFGKISCFSECFCSTF